MFAECFSIYTFSTHIEIIEYNNMNENIIIYLLKHAKNIAKSFEIYMHNNLCFYNKWNIIQAFSIQEQTYQPCPTAIWTKCLLACKIINNLCVVMVIQL